jgi:hypothetical protein
MENLHNRKKQKAPEDQVEFLDEQGRCKLFSLAQVAYLHAISFSIEQEELLKDLRRQNDSANLSIQASCPF